MPVRVYVPASAAQLRRLSDQGVLGPAPLPAYAVTPDLRQAHSGADAEELEYLALLGAAGSASGAVVVAADVEAESVGDGVGSEVRLSEPVAMRQVASFHVPGGTAPAGGPELSWYDATELAVVLDLPGGRRT